MMFYEKFEHRIAFWHAFRQDLETHPDPFDKVIQFWNRAPISARSCDPFDQKSWPGAWQLIEENEYCDFSKILAIYYTLSLTDRFHASRFEISVTQDKKNEKLYYLLYIDDVVIGYHYDRIVYKKDLPAGLFSQANYVLAPSHDH